MKNSKKSIIVTGGAGFIGSNLIQLLLEKTKFNIISLDNYSTGIKRNHIKNRIKLIYSATSATLGNKGNDKNLSPYAFTKATNLELLENLKKWFNFKYEVVYF